MGGFVGQRKLLDRINGYTLQTLPHTLLFIGDEGCGKKTMAKYLANKIGLDLVWVDDVDDDTLSDFQQRPIKTLYAIDLTTLNLEKEQNQFLKFMEEPSEYAYVALLANSEVGVLPTVLNRCVKLRFEPYTIEQLRQIKPLDNALAYRVCRTPGQLTVVDDARLTDMEGCCKALTSGIKTMSLAKAVGYGAKVNYKEDYNKFDFETFLNMLELTALDSYKKNHDKTALDVYLYVMRRRQELLRNQAINKEAFMTNLLVGLHKEING